MEVIIMKFGEKVRAARLAAHYSQRQLANMTGIALLTGLQKKRTGSSCPKSTEALPTAIPIHKGISHI